MTSIPKTSVLSMKNSGIADIIEKAELGGTLGLTFALSFEIEQGKKSPWFGYLQSLPAWENVPLFWSKDDQDLLVDTELEDYIDEYSAALTDDFNTHIAPLIEENPSYFAPEENPGHIRRRRLFFEASSLVSSRAFEVDDFHGTAMVPFADLYNHKTAAENVHIESEGDVCIFCGSAFGCNCQDDQEDEDHHHAHDESGRHEHDHPHHDHRHGEECNHKPSQPLPITETFDELKQKSVKELRGILVEWAVDFSDCVEKADLVERVIQKCGPRDDTADDADNYSNDDDDDKKCPILFDERKRNHHHQHQHIGGCCDDSESEQGSYVEDCLEMRVVHGVCAGNEVFNTYGDHTNASLLSRYGFVERDNPFDVVCMKRDRLIDIVTVRLGASRVEERLTYWEEFGRDVVNELTTTEEEELEEEQEGNEEPDEKEREGGGRKVENEGTHSHDEKHDDEDDDEWVDLGNDDNNEDWVEEENQEQEEIDEGLAEDNLKMNFTHNGTASHHLVVFLHLLHLDAKTFSALTRDKMVFQRYVEHLIASSGEPWIVKPKKSGSGGVLGDSSNRERRQRRRQQQKQQQHQKYQKQQQKLILNATRSPVVKLVNSALVLAAQSRLSRLLSRQAGVIDDMAPGPTKWAWILRDEECKILQRAISKYG